MLYFPARSLTGLAQPFGMDPRESQRAKSSPQLQRKAARITQMMDTIFMVENARHAARIVDYEMIKSRMAKLEDQHKESDLIELTQTINSEVLECMAQWQALIKEAETKLGGTLELDTSFQGFLKMVVREDKKSQ